MKKLFFIVGTIMVIAGCGTNENGSEARQQNTVQVKNSTIQQVDRKTGQEISRHLVELAADVPNVNDAAAVVVGKYAIVGIDVKPNLDRSEVGTIKYSVAEALKNDPYGARAVVVADPDMTARLKELSNDIQRGKPLQGIMNELADITGRLIPEVPADIIDSNPENAPVEQKKKLGGQNQNQLEKRQDQQSNQQKD